MPIYPNITDYLHSFRHAEEFMKSERLKALETLPSPFIANQIHFMTGRFGCVVKVRLEGKGYAAKMFLHYDAHREKRLAEISRFIAQAQSPYLLPFEYYTDELWVSGDMAQGDFPLVLMPWAEGKTLGEYVSEKAKKGEWLAIDALYEAFVLLADYLLEAPFAHGDLKHDNIIVGENAKLTLVDYDGIYLPSLAHLPSGELGGSAFQHPERKNFPYCPQIDDFPILVILLALKALSLEPALINLRKEGDHLLFIKEDFENPMESELIKKLWLMPDPELRQLLGLMLSSLAQTHIKVIGLRAFVGKSLKKQAIRLKEELQLLKQQQTLSPPPTKTLLIGGSEPLKLIYVEGGEFMMGYDPNRDGEDRGMDDAKPLHKARLDGFYMAETQVTNAQYAAFLNEYGSDVVKDGEHKGLAMIYEHKWGVEKVGNKWQPQSGFENHPVVYVTWYGADEFCRFYGGSLPSEAQWEYAARGGNKSKGYKYAGSNNLDEVAWYDKNSGSKTHPVRQKLPNELGLYDMSGNVWEWCQDYYDEKFYETADAKKQNPLNNKVSDYMLLRGGSWYFNDNLCRSAVRYGYYPSVRDNDNGFRLSLRL
ncbi:SUMF1/EgtB/PvdO family nonheme iron enzyme [Hugenholtzia roseola]|uniref:SUMF1/EgtB/PvdO family nonheme iron enzyme n=1 Tax=Hugenholtzia roseola TaxID=1002 RepID=UPI0003F65422|nr:SUMF1/EgtB/PvdO family nonheme iron enzyme [Hugenholtzia roseola]